MDLAQPTDLDNPIFGSEQPGIDSDSDSGGTGERGAALLDEEADDARDILPDSVHSLSDEALDSEDVSAQVERELSELSDSDEDDLSEGEEDEEDEGRDSDTRR
jgi:hypothetical protein